MVVRTFTINFVDLECKILHVATAVRYALFSLFSLLGHSSITLSFESICLPFILAKATFSLFLGFQKLYSICLDNRDCNFHLLSKNISLFFSLLALLLPLGRLPPEKMLSACFTDFYTQHNWTWHVRNSQCSLRWMGKVSTSRENALYLFHRLLYPAQLNVACERQPMLRWMESFLCVKSVSKMICLASQVPF